MANMFSTKGMYALRAMADLAVHDGWVSLGDVSERQHISRKYLEQVISLMHRCVEKAVDTDSHASPRSTRLARFYVPPKEILLRHLVSIAQMRRSVLRWGLAPPSISGVILAK